MIKCPECSGPAEITGLNDDFENIHTCNNCGFRFTPNTLKDTEMQSNTKLTTNQKEILKSLKLNNLDVTLVNNMQTTIAYQEKGNTVEFSLAVMSDNEKKFRRKVGEYNALMRFESGYTVKMNKYDFTNMLDHVFNFNSFYL